MSEKKKQLQEHETAISCLAMRVSENPTEKDIEEARKVMRLFYHFSRIDKEYWEIVDGYATCDGTAAKMIGEAADWLYSLLSIIFEKYDASIYYPSRGYAELFDLDRKENLNLVKIYSPELWDKL